MEADVRSQISHLNSVLNYLNEVLTVDVDAALTNATMNLNSTHFKIQAAEDLLVKTKEHVMETQLFLQGNHCS